MIKGVGAEEAVKMRRVEMEEAVGMKVGGVEEAVEMGTLVYWKHILLLKYAFLNLGKGGCMVQNWLIL